MHLTRSKSEPACHCFEIFSAEGPATRHDDFLLASVPPYSRCSVHPSADHLRVTWCCAPPTGTALAMPRCACLLDSAYAAPTAHNGYRITGRSQQVSEQIYGGQSMADYCRLAVRTRNSCQRLIRSTAGLASSSRNQGERSSRDLANAADDSIERLPMRARVHQSARSLGL
jgi:hypothetical protein